MSNTRRKTDIFRVKMGEVFVDKLAHANWGVQTLRRVNGKRCFIQNENTAELAGDTWRLQLVTQNPAKTVYFANLVEIVDSECGGALAFRNVTRAELNQVRRAHKYVITVEKRCAPLGSPIPLADAMLATAKVHGLAKTYRHYLIQRSIGIYTKVGMQYDRAYLEAHKVLVEVTPEDSLPRVRARLEEIKRRFASDPPFVHHSIEGIRCD